MLIRQVMMVGTTKRMVRIIASIIAVIIAITRKYWETLQEMHIS